MKIRNRRRLELRANAQATVLNSAVGQTFLSAKYSGNVIAAMLETASGAQTSLFKPGSRLLNRVLQKSRAVRKQSFCDVVSNTRLTKITRRQIGPTFGIKNRLSQLFQNSK